MGDGGKHSGVSAPAVVTMTVVVTMTAAVTAVTTAATVAAAATTAAATTTTTVHDRSLGVRARLPMVIHRPARRPSFLTTPGSAGPRQPRARLG
jgi:hypothetical protein